jgi:uncharacterized damage-inducible protein DinB
LPYIWLMKKQFIRLFDYDHFANQVIFKAIHGMGRPPRALTLMAHLLAASQTWLLRCEGESSAGVNLWPEVAGGSGLGPDAEIPENQVRLSSLEEAIDNNHRAWIKFLEAETDFGRTVPYRNQSGKAYHNELSDLLSHLLNHGTHHRAQIGQLLKAEGLAELPPTDYILYLRMVSPGN